MSQEVLRVVKGTQEQLQALVDRLESSSKGKE
jgi:hypothetical protein